MRSSELVQFLTPYQDVVALTSRVQNLLLADAGEDSIARFVKYSPLDEQRLGLQADVLHVRVIGRFEASKYDVNSRDFIAGQYVFYRKTDDREVRMSAAVRFVGNESVVLPSGNIIQMFADMDDENAAIQYNIRTIRNSISEALLSEVVASIEKWEFS